MLLTMQRKLEIWDRAHPEAARRCKSDLFVIGLNFNNFLSEDISEGEILVASIVLYRIVSR